MKHRHCLYLASPYSHPDPKVMAARAKETTDLMVTLLKNGIFTFAPIVYNANLSVDYQLPGSWDFWLDFDLAFVSRMEGVLVAKQDGWDKSVGVKAEVEHAHKIGLPVFYATPEEILKNDLQLVHNFIKEIDAKNKPHGN